MEYNQYIVKQDKRSVFSKFLLNIVLFLFFYNIPLHLIKLPFSSGKIIALVSFAYIAILALVRTKNIYFSKYYLNFLIPLILSFLVVFIILKIIYNTQDIYYLQVYFFYIFEYLFGAIFIISFFKIKSLEEFFESVIFIAVLQALIMVLCLFFQPLKDFVLAVLSADPGFSLFSGSAKLADGFRGLSLAADRTLGLSVFFSFSIMFIYCLLILKKSKINYFYYILCFIIIFIGGVLAARTFFVGLFFGLVFILIIFYKYSKQAKSLKKYFFTLFIIFTLIIASIPAIIDSFFIESKQEIELGMKWAFELFYNFFEQGSFRTSSSDALADEHLAIIPYDIQTILIGDSNRKFISPGFHYSSMFSDIGYVRMLMVYGLIGSFAVYLFWIYIIRLVQKLYRDIPIIKFLLFFMALTLFAGNAKYDLFPGSAITLKLLVMLFVLAVNYNKGKQISI